MDDDAMAILCEFAKTSDLAALKSQLPERSILDSLQREIHNDNQKAMDMYMDLARGESIDLQMGLSDGSVKVNNVNFFESPSFGSGDTGDNTDELLASFDSSITRMMSDTIPGHMTSANLMKNWIQEDDDENVDLLLVGLVPEQSAPDSYAMDGATADRSPIVDMSVKYPSTPSGAGKADNAPMSQPPSLPMMLRQEARPGRKGSMGKLTHATVTPSTGQPSDPLSLTPPPAIHSPIFRMEPAGIFSPSKDRLTPAADAPTTPARTTDISNDSKWGSSPMGPQVVDSSVLGDYCHWTAGPRLSATGTIVKHCCATHDLKYLIIMALYQACGSYTLVFLPLRWMRLKLGWLEKWPKRW